MTEQKLSKEAEPPLPYSPNSNPIEHHFAALKKRREYQEHVAIDDIVKAYQ